MLHRLPRAEAGALRGVYDFGAGGVEEAFVVVEGVGVEACGPLAWVVGGFFC